MAYYLHEQVQSGSVLGPRRPTINEFYLSSYTLSMYTGCEFGCPYCDGWAFNQRPLNESVRIPIDLPQRLALELDAVDRGDLIGITALSDAYQPAEQQYRLTRQVLQLFADRGQPTLILTKGVGVLEDIPLLRRINEQSLAVVMTTLVTTDTALAERLEHKAPPPALRLEMLSELKRAGIPVGVAILPIVPYINDSDHALRALLRSCAQAEVDFVVWDYLHLPNERHRSRINEILARVGNYPASYYRDIYRDQSSVSSQYRRDRDTTLLDRCDGFGLEPRAPHRLYAGRLHPSNEAALLLKHAAFRDRVQGRSNMAAINRDLAEKAYAGVATLAELQQSSMWPQLRPLVEGA
jgi:DNA repair photolyase